MSDNEKKPIDISSNDDNYRPPIMKHLGSYEYYMRNLEAALNALQVINDKRSFNDEIKGSCASDQINK